VSHPVLARLRSDDPSERRAACAAAVRDPSAVLLVDALADALGDPEPAVMRAASDALVELERDAPSVRSALAKALRSDDATRRWGAASTWARIEPPPLRLLPALVETLGLPARHARWAAARLLVHMGRLHGEVLPVLLAIAREDDRPQARRMAVYALRELAPDAPETARVLLEAARAPDLPLRRAALTSLASLLDPPRAVISHLIEILDADPDGASRRIAATSLGELGASAADGLAPEAHAALKRAERDPGDPLLRRGARRALGRAARQDTATAGPRAGSIPRSTRR
jgi:HEAT repeat protein